MKNKRIILLFSILLLLILLFNIKLYAVTLPELRITSNNYSVGDKMRFDNEMENVEVGNTLQLYIVSAHGNDMILDNNLDSLGWFVDKVNLNGVTWTSSNTSIATVNNSGKVTGISEGKTTITALYNEETANYEVNVKPYTGIWIATEEPEPAKILNQNYSFNIYLYNIPDTEKENINVTIDNENIAEITGIDLCDGKKMIKANVKFLSLGQFKISATLNYNGNNYLDDEIFTVVESPYSLSISTQNHNVLPESLNIGEQLQLIAYLDMYENTTLAYPKDVTSNGAIWTSSDEKIINVDSNGLVTAIGKGTATITAKYTIGEEILTATYNVTITDSSNSPLSPEKLSDDGDTTTAKTILPQTGKGTIIMYIIFILLLLSISVIIYKGYQKYKKI